MFDKRCTNWFTLPAYWGDGCVEKYHCQKSVEHTGKHTCQVLENAYTITWEALAGDCRETPKVQTALDKHFCHENS